MIDPKILQIDEMFLKRNKIYRLLYNPLLIFSYLGHREFLNWMDDKTYLKILWWIKFKTKLNLDNPRLYNEKLQWLKLYERKPEYTMMADKYEVKKYVSGIIGDNHIIPTLGVWDRPEDIDFDNLPNQFVLKCTHDSGGVIICKDKVSFNKKKTLKKLKKCLKHNYFWGLREWPYKNVKPRVIAEKYIEDEITGELHDYKFFCFDGIVKALFVATDRMKKDEETKFDFFDENFNHLPFTNGHPNAAVTPLKPAHFEEMKYLAAKLSKNIPHVRVDFYEVNNKVYFGEMTFFHWSGFTPFVPETWDEEFGKFLKLY